MPRKARLDAPGALHHIIFRGIERREIFQSLAAFIREAGTNNPVDPVNLD